MDLITSQIDQKLIKLNYNGKIRYLLDIIQHCLHGFPDLKNVPANTISNQIDQLGALVKYILLNNNESLEMLGNVKIDDLRKIQTKNDTLKAKIETLETKLNIEKSDKKDLQETSGILEKIDSLLNKTDISKYDLVDIKNKFKHMKSLSEELPDLDSDLNKCHEQIDTFETKLKKIISEKEEFENFLRTKINEV